MRFIHTSDWQLGKPFGRASDETRAALQEARLDAIDRIAEAARKEGAPIVLVAGDVFDSSEPGDRVYRQALTRMKGADDVAWVLLPGNHDPARADGLWTRLSGEAPANVTACLEPRPLEVNDGAWVLPAPLQYKRTLEDPTAWFDDAETPAGALRIGLAHGPIRDFSGQGSVANLLAPDRARRAGLHYLALGDWHGRLAVDPFTHYSGTPEPDDFGREVTGVALRVDLNAHRGPDVSELPTGRYTWADANWTLTSIEALEPLLSDFAHGTERPKLVARLKLSGMLTLAERVAVRGRLENNFAHEVRWLDLSLAGLYARPTAHDMADIDISGVLRDAAERLLALTADGGEAGRRAAAALERLYIEHQHAERQGADA